MSSPDPESVPVLVLKAQAGDAEAFAELVRRYEGAVFRLALRITGTREDAQDAAQETFLRAYRGLSRFDPQRPFGPWLLKIAANRALSKAGRRRNTAPLDEAMQMREETGREDAARDELESVRCAMTDLAPADRAILALRYEEGMKVAEIARTLDIQQGAVKVRLLRARERLMRVMKTEGR